MPAYEFTKLDELSDEDILKELMSRYDHFIMAGMKVDTRGNNILYDWKGDEVLCIELCAEIIAGIKEIEDEEENDG